ncbi:MAG TPA: tetratricopeptide repeat protein [Blastocatellia bacterium]|nr:tetratricopeptide repeat protein [Blastocatellia bacterium]
MSSLSTKTNRSRSTGSQKVLAKKGKKSALKKPQRPGKITAAPKAKKTLAPKAKKQAASAKKAVESSKKVIRKKTAAAPSSGKAAKKPVSKQAATKPAARTAPAPPPAPRKSVQQSTVNAVRAFEQALKVFNRHDFSNAKAGFESILEKFGDQADIVARARTYLRICEQRLARTPSIPRNPDALYDQGVFELNKNNFRAAIEMFEKALRSQPRADHVIYSLAAAHARMNDTPRALDALRRAIALRPVHRSHARRDLDFASLRSNHDFQQLTGFGYDYSEE